MPSVVSGEVARSGLKDCKEIDVFDIRVTEPPHDVVEGARTIKGVWKEDWTLRMCGQLHDVAVTFVPDANGGGTSFSTTATSAGQTAPNPSHAGTPRDNERDAVIDRIQATYFSTTLFSGDSPLLKSFLVPAEKANPGVSQQVWTEVAKEFAAVLSKLMLGKGGLMDSILRPSLQQLSDAELRRLEEIATDPVYLKLQSITSSPETQQRLLRVMAGNVLNLNGAINGVLASHRLNEVH
jgi:hypothetical protein